MIGQNALPGKIGQSTSALVFFRSIGGTIGLAAMGSIMTSAYQPAFQNALPATIKRLASVQPAVAKFLGLFSNPEVLLQPDVKAQLFAGAQKQGPQAVAMLNQVIEAVKVGLTQGIHNVFILSLVLMVLGTITVLFLKEIPLRGGSSQKQSETTGTEEPELESSLATMI